MWDNHADHAQRQALLPPHGRQQPIHVDDTIVEQGQGGNGDRALYGPVEAEMRKRLRVLQTDHGGEFTSIEFA